MVALRDRAFETPLARRWREEKEQREREEQERLEAEHQAEIEHEALSIKAEIAELRYELMWAELCRKYGYNPNQPRANFTISDAAKRRSRPENIAN